MRHAIGVVQEREGGTDIARECCDSLVIPRRKQGSAYDHKALARLAITRDVERAVAALHRHIDLTEQPTRKTMPADWQRALGVGGKRESAG